MRSFLLSALANLLAAAAASAQTAQPPMSEAEYRGLANLVPNASFEMDWMHNKVTANTRFMLLEQSDWGYAQADGRPDYWIVSDGCRLDPSTAKFGKKSLRLSGTAALGVYLLGETDPRDGGAFYNAFRPVPVELARHVKPRPLRFGAWCKTAQAKVAPSFAIVMEYGSENKIVTRTHSATFGAGTHDWEYREIAIPPAGDLGPAHVARIHLAFQGEGACWFDGLLGEEKAANEEPNLVPNPSFEALEADWPAGWSRPVLWTWARREYYRFTGWSHENGAMAGGALVAPMGHASDRSLQFTLLPGDNLAVKSGKIALNQSEPRVLEVSAWVKAEDLRWLEIMAQDESGKWLPQQDFSGCMGTDEHYRNRVAGIGSHDWEFLRKHFVPTGPVRELTLWLCARGMDGKQMARNVVGTVWFDDIALRERGTARAELEKRRVTIPQAVKPTAAGHGYRVLELDLGERLWGVNQFKIVTEPIKGQPVQPALGLQLLGPGSEELLNVTPWTSAAKTIDYRLTDLPASWQGHFQFKTPWPMQFGTPASPVGLRLAGSYFYPDETLEVGVNLHVTHTSLKDVALCKVLLRHPDGDKVLLETKDVAQAMWTAEQPRPKLLTDGHVDARNLIVVRIPAAGFRAHPHHHPVRDCTVVVALLNAAGKIIAQQASEPFGFLDKPAPEKLPERIEKTEVVEGGTVFVNGKPYIFNCFPAGPADLGDISRSLNFPKSHKLLALPYPKDLVFGPKDENSWKQKIQAFARSKKDDPTLFGWFFNHDGETTFWLKNWREMAACQRKVTAWVKEIDPNHIVLSARWLFGHGALNAEDGKQFAFLDVIDVEPGLTWTPDSQAVRKAAGRPVAIVAGLECYYFQPPTLLRWRVYEALRQGANGIGICPSGMLHARPEIVSFLRGLHGEVQGLEPLITGKTPVGIAKPQSPQVTVWERQAGKTRYVVAMVGEHLPETKGGADRIALPGVTGKVEVMFEGRSLELNGGAIADSFPVPYTVHVYRMEEK